MLIRQKFPYRLLFYKSGKCFKNQDVPRLEAVKIVVASDIQQTLIASLNCPRIVQQIAAESITHEGVIFSWLIQPQRVFKKLDLVGSLLDLQQGT